MTSFFKNLFRKKIDVQTLPSKDTNPDASRQPVLPHIPSGIHLDVPQLNIGVAQSVGMERDHNEDALFTLTTNLASDEKAINSGLYIIADGMGGHDYGELASSLAVGKLAAHVIDALFLPTILYPNNKIKFSIQEIMQAGVMEAHEAIKQEAVGGGTTLTAALIIGDQVTIAHVGDSRAYSIDPAGNIVLLTHDHTLVKRLEEIGQISPEEASNHPQRNVLYRALGQGEPFEPDISSFQLCQGCQLMLCSDGLWGVVPESQISDIIRSSPEPQLVCQSLIDSANAAGGPDNISVIIIRISA